MEFVKCKSNLDFDDLFGIPCGHVFHYECLWLNRDNICPMCRRITAEEEIHPTFLNINTSYEQLRQDLDKKTSDLAKSEKNNQKLKTQYNIRGANIKELNKKIEKLQYNLKVQQKK